MTSINTTKEIFFYNSAGAKPIYYQISLLTLFLSFIATWGLFAFWWHFMNWRKINKNIDCTVSPLARTYFHPYFAYALYDTIAESSNSVKPSNNIMLRIIGTLYVITGLPWLIIFDEQVLYLVIYIEIFCIFSLLFEQFKVNQLNRIIGHSITKSYKSINALLFIGILVQVLGFFIFGM